MAFLAKEICKTENDDIKAPEGSRAVVVRIEGVKLIVKPLG